jgi:hypothetical protein
MTALAAFRQLPSLTLLLHFQKYQHPHHQFRIDRSPADLAVIRLQLRAHTAQHRRLKNIDASERMFLRNAIFEPKLIEQTRLIASLPPPIIAVSKRLTFGTSGITRRIGTAFDQQRPGDSAPSCWQAPRP